jgi:hypothetical protein
MRIEDRTFYVNSPPVGARDAEQDPCDAEILALAQAGVATFHTIVALESAYRAGAPLRQLKDTLKTAFNAAREQDAALRRCGTAMLLVRG